MKKRMITATLATAFVATACHSAAPNPPPRPIPTPDEIYRDYQWQMKTARFRMYDQIYWPVCETPRREGRDCGLLADHLSPIVYEDFVLHTCNEDSVSNASERCQHAYGEAFLKNVEKRYSSADPGAIGRACAASAEACDTFPKLELLFLEAHDKKVFADGTRRLDELAAEHRNAQREAQRERERRADDAAAAESRQRALAAVAAGLQAGSSAFANSVAPNATSSNAPSCSNDYQCGYGKYCVKDQYAGTGSCATVVNRYGTPTFAPPRPSSVYVGGPGECAYDSECGIGFRCVKGNATRGHCMK